jgi:hypothetical protein
MGDSAFVMYNNKAVPILIMGVHYSLDRYAGEITYYSANISTGNGLERFKEEVFKTKKELLDYEIEDKDKRNNRRLYA